MHEGPVNQLDFHPSGSLLISVSDDKTIKIMDAANGELIYTLYGHGRPVRQIQFAPTGLFFATAGADDRILLWKNGICPTC